MNNFRMARINKQLQREIALIINNEIKKEALKEAIITGVECTKDLDHARIFITALEKRKRPGILKELTNMKSVIRGLLSERIQLRKIPDLDFIIDKSEDYGEKIDNILAKLGLINNDKDTDSESDNENDDIN